MRRVRGYDPDDDTPTKGGAGASAGVAAARGRKARGPGVVGPAPAAFTTFAAPPPRILRVELVHEALDQQLELAQKFIARREATSAPRAHAAKGARLEGERPRLYYFAPPHQVALGLARRRVEGRPVELPERHGC